MTSVPNTDQAIVQSNKWDPRRERNRTPPNVRWPTGQVTQLKSEDTDTQQDSRRKLPLEHFRPAAASAFLAVTYWHLWVHEDLGNGRFGVGCWNLFGEPRPDAILALSAETAGTLNWHSRRGRSTDWKVRRAGRGSTESCRRRGCDIPSRFERCRIRGAEVELTSRVPAAALDRSDF